MAYTDPRYVDHQRKRFMRHDGDRYLRPDWERYMRPDWRDRKYWIGKPPAHPFELTHASQPARTAPPPEDLVEIAAIERERRAIEWNMAALRLQRAWLELGLQQRKAYNPNQPRVPAEGSGRAMER